MVKASSERGIFIQVGISQVLYGAGQLVSGIGSLAGCEELVNRLARGLCGRKLGVKPSIWVVKGLCRLVVAGLPLSERIILALNLGLKGLLRPSTDSQREEWVGSFEEFLGGHAEAWLLYPQTQSFVERHRESLSRLDIRLPVIRSVVVKTEVMMNEALPSGQGFLQTLLTGMPEAEEKVFHINNDEDMKALTALSGREYKAGRQERPRFVISRIAVLPGGAYGVLTNDGLKLNKRDKGKNNLGPYVGDGFDEALETGYSFEVAGGIHYIDAAKSGDWTAYVNHSETPNLAVHEHRGLIYFDVAADVLPGEQLFIDYGEHYFCFLDYKPLYLHSSDNQWSPRELMRRYQADYWKDVFVFGDEGLARLLRLGSSGAKGLLLSRLSQAIIEEPRVNRSLLQAASIDRLSYLVEVIDGHHWALSSQQEHWTPLMIACALKRWDWIVALVNNGASINRRTLQTGYTPLFLLLHALGGGETTPAEGFKCIELLLEKGAWVHLVSRDDETLLSGFDGVWPNDYVIERLLDSRQAQAHKAVLIKHLLEIDEHLDLSSCLIVGRLDLFVRLLSFVGKPWVCQQFQDKEAEFLRKGYGEAPLQHLLAASQKLVDFLESERCGRVTLKQIKIILLSYLQERTDYNDTAHQALRQALTALLVAEQHSPPRQTPSLFWSSSSQSSSSQQTVGHVTKPK